MILRAFTLLTTTLAFSGTAFAVTATKQEANVTQEQVEAAQAAWGAALVRISVAHASDGIEMARQEAETALDALYGFEMGPVLFKPTLAAAPHTFRTTRDGALSYFVGHDEDFPQDKGFALNGWSEVAVENAAIFISQNTAMTSGQVHITGPDGAVTTVDKTWGFQRDEAGELRIVLHHSSLPFAAE